MGNIARAEGGDSMVFRPRPMLSALLLAAATGALPPMAAPAAAQPAQPPQRSFAFSKEERAALLPVQTAIAAKDWPAAVAALPAAQAAARGPDALYALGASSSRSASAPTTRGCRRKGWKA